MNTITLSGTATLYGFPEYWAMRKFRDGLKHYKYAGELAYVTEMQAKIWVTRFAATTHSGGFQNYRYWGTEKPSKEAMGTAKQSFYSAVALLDQPVNYIVVV